VYATVLSMSIPDKCWKTTAPCVSISLRLPVHHHFLTSTKSFACSAGFGSQYVNTATAQKYDKDEQSTQHSDSAIGHIVATKVNQWGYLHDYLLLRVRASVALCVSWDCDLNRNNILRMTSMLLRLTRASDLHFVVL